MKILRNIRFKWIVWRFDNLMWNYQFGATRKYGVNDLQVYKAAIKFKKIMS